MAGATPVTVASSSLKAQQPGAEPIDSSRQVRDFSPGSNDAMRSSQARIVTGSGGPQDTLNELKSKLMEARRRLVADDFSAMASLSAAKLSKPLETAIVSFANFHQLNNSSEHSIRSSKSAFNSFGKILGSLTYFDYECVTEEQESIARDYVLSHDQVAAVPEAQALHQYMNKLRHYYVARQGVTAAK